MYIIKAVLEKDVGVRLYWNTILLCTFLSANVAGFLAYFITPMTRGLMSKIAPADKQGIVVIYCCLHAPVSIISEREPPFNVYSYAGPSISERRQFPNDFIKSLS